MARQSQLPVLLFGLLVCVGFPTISGARSVVDSEYSLQQTFNGALRYLSIDLGYEVVERDKDAAYLLFRFESDEQKRRGAIEIIETKAGVQLVISLPDLPEYREDMMKAELMKKLRRDYGQPAGNHKKKKKPPKKKKDDDSSEDDGSVDNESDDDFDDDFDDSDDF